MRFSTIFAAAALFIGAQATLARNGTVYTTEVVTEYVTYCPEPTEIVHNGKTITVTEATTVTISDCPCTIIKPVITATSTSCVGCDKEIPLVTGTGGGSGPKPSSTGGYVHPSPSQSSPPPFLGGADRTMVASGAGLAGLLGLALAAF